VILWRLAGARSQIELEGHRASARALAWSRDGEMLASGDAGLQVILWRVAEAQAFGRLRAAGAATDPSAGITALAFDRAGSSLVSGTGGGRITTWQVALPAWQHRACDVAGRELARTEWQRFVGDGHDWFPVCR
jgi:WD40 repeat protein